MTLPTTAKKKFYPAKRKKAVRSRDSYRAKTVEGKAKQLENLKLGRGRKRYRKIPGLDMDSKARLSESDLQALDIVQFSEFVLGVDFSERPAQKVILKSLYVLPLVDGELELYTQLTTNESIFESGIEKTEGVWAVGARGGKSFLTSVIALYEATRSKWQQYLAPGEQGYAVIVATKLQQAQDIIGANCARLLENSRIKHMIAESWTTSLVLTNGMCVASYPCNSTAARGLPIFLLIFDEVAHFRVEGPKADELINNALRPRMAQFPGAKCLKISTPSAKQGLLWDEFSEGFQVPGRLTIQAPTRVVNPLIPQDFIDKEYKRDFDNAEREFGAEFAEQVDAFFEGAALEACFVLTGDILPDFRHKYFLGCDQAGGGKDFFAAAICHREKDEVLVDCLREWRTKKLDAIFSEIELMAKDYNLSSVVIDRYASGYVSNMFEKIGLTTELRPMLPVVYVNGKRLVMAGLLKMPTNKRLRLGLLRTQSYYGRNQSLSIAHERSAEFGHSDICDAVMSTVWSASNRNEGGYFTDALRKMDERILQEKQNGQKI